MEFEIREYYKIKSEKLNFFKETDLVFANIENEETMGSKVLLAGVKGKEKIILVEEKIISSINNIIKLPNGNEVIEATLSNYCSFDDLYLNENMELLKTSNSETITSLGNEVEGGIEAEIQKPFISMGDVSATEVILGILNEKMQFIVRTK